MKIGKTEFDLLRSQIYRLCGLIIPEGKEYLIEHRFSNLLKSRGCKSWQDFLDLLSSGDTRFKDDVISSISTNETSFFRDNHPFNIIRQKILPALVKAKKPSKTINIWCAASSSGQEPYSLAMLIHEYCSGKKQQNISPSDFSILATDISGKILDKARRGVFNKHEIARGLPAGYIKYFYQCRSGWAVDDSVKNMVKFKKFNLLESFGRLGKFDFVMCRNVLIYFDDETKIDIVHRIHRLLPDDGYLMLGATETLAGHTDWFTSEHHGVVILYKKDKEAALRNSPVTIPFKSKRTFSV